MTSSPEHWPRRVAILGSTGSIGRQALEVAEAFPDLVKIVGLAAGGLRAEAFATQVRKWRPEVAAVSLPGPARQAAAETGTRVLEGREGVLAVATMDEADLVLHAMVGFAGAEPALLAIRAGKDLALANKEPIVALGHILMGEAAARGVRLLPVDSEPSAIHQLLEGAPSADSAGPPQGSERRAALARIILTASGGPFYGRSPEELARVTPAEALNHPTWRMGPKVSVDSATLMNKGLEVIEASRLFGLPVDRIDVVIHRASLVHSMVVMADGVTLAHLGPPDMRYPIQFALTYPRRVRGPWPGLELGKAPPLTFTHADSRDFPCLRLAYEVGRIGKSLPAVLSAADEVVVAEFLEERLSFSDIPRLLDEVASGHEPFEVETLEDAGMADEAGRRLAKAALGRLHGRRRTVPGGGAV